MIQKMSLESISMSQKKFKDDIYKMKDRLVNKEIFSFSKFADGEWSIIKDKDIDNTEFNFNSSQDSEYRQQLINSFQYRNDRYYVGVSCPCCQNDAIHNEMKEFSGQSEDMLTWANIWVNSNYPIFLKEILPIFSEYDVYLVANEKAKIENIPFKVKRFYPVSNNAWKNNSFLIDQMKNDITDSGIRQSLFLFCCGPFGNILCHELTRHNDQNTYLDIGSTLNIFFGTGFYRGYYRLSQSMSDCVWGNG